MPAEKITMQRVDNGPGDRHTNVLRVAWGHPGSAPDAPDGWVNAGYTLVSIDVQDSESGETVSHGVWLGLSELEHLERVVRRSLRKRRAHEEQKRGAVH